MRSEASGGSICGIMKGGRLGFSALALMLLSACDARVIEGANTNRDEQVAQVGGEYNGVREVLLLQGYEERPPTFGPPREEWTWDRCLTKRVSYPLQLAGGQRWVCMQLNSTGEIVARRASYFVMGPW